jgi:hypothetical protein
VNAVLAFIEAAEPKNEIEAALAIQMACTHAVTMAVLSRAGGAYGGDRHVAIMASAGARLNAFSAQLETMRRLRITTPNRPFLRGFPATQFPNLGLCGRSRILVAGFGGPSPHPKIPFPATGLGRELRPHL